MGFQTRKVSSFVLKHLKQNIKVSDFEIKLFSHFFVTFGVQRSLVNHYLAHP
jgi:hypothetical protein